MWYESLSLSAREAGLGKALKMTMTTNGSVGSVPPLAATSTKGAATKAKAQRSKRHTPEQIVAKLRDAAAMLNAGKDMLQWCRPWRSVERRTIVGSLNTEG